jgi:hypothetical protein
MKSCLVCIATLLVALGLSPSGAQASHPASGPAPNSYGISGGAYGEPEFYPLLPFRVFYPTKLTGVRFRETQIFYAHEAGSGFPTGVGAGGFTCPSSWSSSWCLSVDTNALSASFGTPALPSLLSSGLIDRSVSSPVTVWFGFRDLSMKSRPRRMVQIAEWRASDRALTVQGTPMVIQGKTATVAVSGATTTLLLVRHATAILVSSNLGLDGTVAVVTELHRLYTSV